MRSVNAMFTRMLENDWLPVLADLVTKSGVYRQFTAGFQAKVD